MSLTSPRVLALVPAHNEADRIADTVRYLYHLAGVERVLVVDDGSSDGTAEAAVAAGAAVIRRERNVGKGGALEGALSRLHGSEPDVYLLVDADVGATAAAAAPLLAVVFSGQADLAIGRLPGGQSGGLGVVKRASAAMIRACSGFEATEPLSGQRAATARCLQACRPIARGFGVETAMTIDAVRLGFRVVEVDVEMRHRPTGRGLSGFTHRGRQGLDASLAAAPRRLGLR